MSPIKMLDSLKLFNTISIENFHSVFSVYGSIINVENCSSTSLDYCNSLNRYPCKKIANTCGSCKSSFIGENGDKNSLCISESTLKKPADGAPDGFVCSADVQCGSWRYCDLVSGTCKDEQKACPGAGLKGDDGSGVCSGHGVCKVFDGDTGISIESCTLIDPSCQAECDCIDGYGGLSCNNEPEVHANKTTVRQNLLSSLQKIILSEDTSQPSFESWTSNLQSFSSSSSELSLESASLVMAITETLFEKSLTMSLSYGSYFPILHSLNNAMDSVIRRDFLKKNDRRYLLRTLSKDVSQVLQNGTVYVNNIIKVLLDDMVVGQEDVMIFESNFRYFAKVTHADMIGHNDRMLQPPLLPVEVNYFNLSLQNIRFSFDLEHIKRNFFKVSVGQMSSMLYSDLDVLSSPFVVTTQGLNNCMDSGLCLFTCELLNNIHPGYIAHPSLDSQYFTVTCSQDKKERYINNTCENGEVVSTFCDGKSSYRVKELCPIVSILPSCSSIVDRSVREDFCRVTSFSNETVHCACEFELVKDQSFHNTRLFKTKSSTSSDAYIDNIVLASTAKRITEKKKSITTPIPDSLPWYLVLYRVILAYQYFFIASGLALFSAVTGYVYYKKVYKVSVHAQRMGRLYKLGLPWDNLKVTANSMSSWRKMDKGIKKDSIRGRGERDSFSSSSGLDLNFADLYNQSDVVTLIPETEYFRQLKQLLFENYEINNSLRMKLGISFKKERNMLNGIQVSDDSKVSFEDLFTLKRENIRIQHENSKMLSIVGTFSSQDDNIFNKICLNTMHVIDSIEDKTSEASASLRYQMHSSKHSNKHSSKHGSMKLLEPSEC